MGHSSNPCLRRATTTLRSSSPTVTRMRMAKSSLNRLKLNRTYSISALKEEVPAAPLANKPYHIFLAYFGDDDDKLALRLVLQLCETSKATATIMRVSASETAGSSSAAGGEDLFAIASSKLPRDIAGRVKFETAAGSTTMEELLQYATTEAGAGSAGAQSSQSRRRRPWKRREDGRGQAGPQDEGRPEALLGCPWRTFCSWRRAGGLARGPGQETFAGFLST